MWFNLIAPFTCQLGLNTLFTYTVPQIWLSPDTLTYDLVKNSYFWQTYFEGLTIMFNIVLSLDLFATLRMPFSAPEQRYPYYLGASLVLPLVPASIRMIYFNERGYFYGKYESAFYLLEIFISLLSIIYATCFICKPGTGKKVLKIIIYRHVCYIIVNILC